MQQSCYEYACESIPRSKRASAVKQLSPEDRKRVEQAVISTPNCFTAQQWKDWKQAARACKPSPLSSFCEDCTPDYHLKMVRENRCAFPSWEFDGLSGKRVFIIYAAKMRVAI